MFVGRQEELRRLEDAYSTGTFQMAVIYGRRRVGKTTLISEFVRDKRALFFTALEQADADNLADFTRAMAEFFGLPGGVRFDSWRDAFDYLCERASQERFVFVFDRGEAQRLASVAPAGVHRPQTAGDGSLRHPLRVQPGLHGE